MIKRFSAGGVVYKEESGGRLWLLIQPRDTDRWQLSKGQIEKGESSQTTALREIKEETGIDGEIIDKIDKTSWWFVQEGEKIFKTAVFYLVKTRKETGRFDKKEVAQIAWLPYNKAYQKLTFKSEKEILERGREVLQNRLF